MTENKEVMRLALDALIEYEYAKTDTADRLGVKAISALREAIAQPVESDDLTIAYMSGFADGKKAAQPAHVPETDCGNILQTEQTKETK